MDEDYVKSKRTVKKWEQNYKKTHHRNPTKSDIKVAPQEVRSAYKLYWLLKTRSLENSILCEDDDIMDGIRELEPVENETKNAASASAWRRHSSNNQLNTVVKPKAKEALDPYMSKTMEKLFKLGKISPAKRNPRKVAKALKKPTPVSPSVKVSGSPKCSSTVSHEDTGEGNLRAPALGSPFKVPESPFKVPGSPFKVPGSPFKMKSPSGVQAGGSPLRVQAVGSPLRGRFTGSPRNIKTSGSPSRVALFGSPFRGRLIGSPLKARATGSPRAAHATETKCLVEMESDRSFPVKSANVCLQSPVKRRPLKINSGWLDRCNDTFQRKMAEKNGEIDEIPNSIEDDDSLKSKNVLITAAVTKTVDNDSDYVYSDEETCEHSRTSLLKPSDMFVAVPILAAPKRHGDEEEMIKPEPKRRKVEAERGGGDDYDDAKKREILAKKLQSGKANENFVSINLKKKVFVRGKKTMTGSKYKKQQWKLRKKFLNGQKKCADVIDTESACFKCGQKGHFARFCKKGDFLMPLDEELLDGEEESPFLTLEDAADLAKKEAENFNAATEALKRANELPEEIILPAVHSLYSSTVAETPAEVFEALHLFGYAGFKPGQEETVMRILTGRSTLTILPTGAGKSLCYQLPAYLYAKRANCITLVVSPLVSLMEDQVEGIPALLGAACYHANQTEKQREAVTERIRNGKVAVLLVSPEAIVSEERSCKSIFSQLPPIAFACIDEVHCVSEWSHNFRTSYLMLCDVLKERFNVRVVLGLTATAATPTVEMIRRELNITDEEGVIRDCAVIPDNLILSASKDERRDDALLTLLTGEPYRSFHSIIIYCIRRDECERLAGFIRTSLQKTREIEGAVRGRLSDEAEPYHAGISASRRKRIQKGFMTGKIRIVVATVAFGMGINKSDVRAIIHYNMPRTFEHYVQEIGRAGRDSLPARCHLFLDSKGGDLSELGRHIYADSVDRHTIRKLLQRVFKKCDCAGACGMHEVCFPVDETVQSLDLPQENIYTLLCYLQLHAPECLRVMPAAYITATIQSYKGINSLKRAAKSCPPLAVAIAQEMERNGDLKGNHKVAFDVVALADKIGWKSGTVKNKLKKCEWTRVDDKYKKTGIMVEFSNLGFRVQSRGNMKDEELDNVLNLLFTRAQKQESNALSQLRAVFQAFQKLAYENVERCFKGELVVKSEDLKETIAVYFARGENHIDAEPKGIDGDEEVILSDVRLLIASYRDCNFTGRTIARVFHGIESPNFPAYVWCRSPFWRRHMRQDFNSLRMLASKELLNFR